MPTKLHQWELIGEGFQRFRVPGGWIYEPTAKESTGIAFVTEPDPPMIDPELLRTLRALEAESQETKEERARIRGLIAEALLFDENEPYDHDARIELQKACRAVLDQLENR